MLRLQNDILEMVATGEPLAVTTNALCLRVQEILPDVVCSILPVEPHGRLKGIVSPN